MLKRWKDTVKASKKKNKKIQYKMGASYR